MDHAWCACLRSVDAAEYNAVSLFQRGVANSVSSVARRLGHREVQNTDFAYNAVQCQRHNRRKGIKNNLIISTITQFVNLLYQAANYLTYSSLPHCTNRRIQITCSNWRHWELENVRIFYIEAVRYSSLSGSRCDSMAVSLRGGKSEKLLKGRNTFTMKYKEVTRKVADTRNTKYRVIQNDCRGFNNLSYTIHLR